MIIDTARGELSIVCSAASSMWASLCRIEASRQPDATTLKTLASNAWLPARISIARRRS